ncbi:AAA family ATPase [Gordonia sp. NPDC003424]
MPAVPPWLAGGAANVPPPPPWVDDEESSYDAPAPAPRPDTPRPPLRVVSDEPTSRPPTIPPAPQEQSWPPATAPQAEPTPPQSGHYAPAPHHPVAPQQPHTAPPQHPVAPAQQHATPPLQHTAPQHPAALPQQHAAPPQHPAALPQPHTGPPQHPEGPGQQHATPQPHPTPQPHRAPPQPYPVPPQPHPAAPGPYGAPHDPYGSPADQRFGPPSNPYQPNPHYARDQIRPQGFGPQGFVAGQPGDGLESAALLRKARRAPRSGWRRTVHRITGGVVNPGDSQQTVYYDDLVRQVNAPVRDDFRIAVLSLKGGVGKTTTTVGLGSTFANLRGDRVIAVDANPDLGTLSQRVRLQTPSTVRDVLLDDSIFRYSDIRRHTSQSSSRLEVLASERDPATAETFNEQDYRSVMRILQRYYNIILTDCGTGLSHSAMNGVLDLAQTLILVSTPALDGARSASATLDWLEAHGYEHLVSRAVVVLSGPRKGSTKIDVDRLAQHFLARTRAVQIVPYDDHLAEGAEVDLALLDKATRRAFVELAATVAEDFAVAGDEREQHHQ